MGSKRGFSSMDPQKQREIASKGGKAAHQKGTAHEFTTEEARIAGRKGGAASRARRSGGQQESDSGGNGATNGHAMPEHSSRTETSDETNVESTGQMDSSSQ